MILTIFVPWLNELENVSAWISFLQICAEQKNCQTVAFIFCDNGSTDQGFIELESKAKSFIGSKSYSLNLIFIRDELRNIRGLLNSLNQTIDRVRTPWLMILPADCKIEPAALSVLTKTLLTTKKNWGFFFKHYEHKNILNRIYSGLQNWILAQAFNLFVWTNAPFFRTSFLMSQLKQTTVYGFLDDLYLSRRMNFIDEKPLLFANISIKVSDRRYRNNGFGKQVLKNGIILLLFLFRWDKRIDVKKFYTRHRGPKP
jgi:hypothetical protein